MRAARAIASAVGVLGTLAVITSTGQAQGAVSERHHPVSGGEASPTSDTAGVTAAQLVELAGAAALRFRSLDSAVAHGYRRLGMDFPAMGEHWVNPGVVLAGKLDPATPAMLSYISVGGVPRLGGIAYALPLDSGETAPPVPGGADMWHEHDGTLEEESTRSAHHGRATSVGGPRLVVLHVWTDVPNPAGPFVAENWSLPFARLGLIPPPLFPEGAARAASLLTGGKTYFLAVARASGDTMVVSRALDRCAEQAAVVLAHPRANRAVLTPAEVDELDTAWRSALATVAVQDAGLARRLNRRH